MEQPTQFSATPLSTQGSYIRRAAAGSCSLPTVLKSCRELLQKGSRKRCPKTHYFIRLSYGPKLYINRPLHKRGLTIELHFSVAGYGGLHLPFHGITQYLRGLYIVSVYECPIIAGVRTSITSSTFANTPHLHAFISHCID